MMEFVYERMRDGIQQIPVHVQQNLLLFNGDCRQVVPMLPKKSVSHICIDPPYNNSKTMQSGIGKDFQTMPMRYENVKFTDREWYFLIKTGFDIMKDGGRQFIFCNQTLQMQIESVIRQNKEWGMRKLLWRHKSGGPLSTDSRCSVGYTEKVVVEYIICVHMIGKFRNSSVYSKPSDRAHEDWLGEFDARIGNDVKPKALYCELLKRYKPGTILDYCMHKGVCGQAAFECGHSFIGVELLNHLFQDASLLLSNAASTKSMLDVQSLRYTKVFVKRPKPPEAKPLLFVSTEYPFQKRRRKNIHSSLSEDQMEDSMYGCIGRIGRNCMYVA